MASKITLFRIWFPDYFCYMGKTGDPSTSTTRDHSNIRTRYRILLHPPASKSHFLYDQRVNISSAVLFLLTAQT